MRQFLKKYPCRYLIITMILLFIDQLTKALAVFSLKTNGEFRLIPGVLHFTYVQNIGAAFGIFRNKQWIFILFAAVIIGLVLWIFPRIEENQRYLPLKALCCVLFAGAVGNMIDRIFHNYVIDFIYIRLIDFPVFNIADIYVCISCFVLVILVFFYYSDTELEHLIRSRKKEAYIQDLIDAVKKEQNHHHD